MAIATAATSGKRDEGDGPLGALWYNVVKASAGQVCFGRPVSDRWGE